MIESNIFLIIQIKVFKMDLQTFKAQLKSIGITKKEFAEKLTDALKDTEIKVNIGTVEI